MIKVRILLVILAASICGSAFAQSGYVYTQYLNSSYASRSIFVCSDNSVVVLGNSDNLEEFHYMSIAITKLDPQGNLLWRRYLDSGASMYISVTGVDIDSEDKVTFLVTRFSGSVINLGTIDNAGVIAFFPNPIQIPFMGLAFN
ncbi:MAG: hypothetical protein U1C33_07085, partial [Candidatus Cloacimonadaceae bacterium]|nr:hypothetical protein [Candidatus Cloacimonadaceae bacterium]